MIIHELHNNMLSSPVRKLEGRVEIHKGSTLALLCECHGNLSKYTIERLGEESKFFGFGICQKMTAVLIDRNREINVSKENYLEAVFGVEGDYIYPFPRFNVVDAKRDENNNNLTITAYDDLYAADTVYVKDLDIKPPYTYKAFVAACGEALGLPIDEESTSKTWFNQLSYNGGNFTGNETIRKALNAIAEATQTIYYVNKDWKLTFKRPDRYAYNVDLRVDRSKYFTLKAGDARTLTNIAHVTDLGDNLISSAGDGATQYIRNNPFWDALDSAVIGEKLDNAVAAIGGLTMNQFECNWRGNYLVEIGDRLEFVTKDNTKISSLLVNDEFSFDGTLSQKTMWNYIDNEGEAAENPTTLGDALNQTYAKVDKTNKRIDLVVKETDEKFAEVAITIDGVITRVGDTENRIGELEVTAEKISARVSDNEDKIGELEVTADNISAKVTDNEDKIGELEVTANSISARVSDNEEQISELKITSEDITATVTDLEREVSTKISADGVNILISQNTSTESKSVDTQMGYTFNEEGLTIQKVEDNVTGEMKTIITEDGMTVFRNNSAVLVANNEGVNAENLHATTYLIVGGRSRFENYESDRTGCFWIGG